MPDRNVKKLAGLVAETDLGIPVSLVTSDLLSAANRALTRNGSPKISDLEDSTQVSRAVRNLERALG
ncbi:hypothetical protein CMI37_36175 [Candidatus Pacearchaeota archaeon]|jgi:hypothetical protein|nr:hypothetical protein [Candidatus Pacearchaeota archaeon]